MKIVVLVGGVQTVDNFVMRFVTMGYISQGMGSGRAYYTNLTQLQDAICDMREKSFEQTPVQNFWSYRQFEQTAPFMHSVLCSNAVTPFEVFDSQDSTYEQVIDNLGNVFDRL